MKSINNYEQFSRVFSLDKFLKKQDGFNIKMKKNDSWIKLNFLKTDIEEKNLAIAYITELDDPKETDPGLANEEVSEVEGALDNILNKGQRGLAR